MAQDYYERRQNITVKGLKGWKANYLGGYDKNTYRYELLDHHNRCMAIYNSSLRTISIKKNRRPILYGETYTLIGCFDDIPVKNLAQAMRLTYLLTQQPIKSPQQVKS